MVFLVEREIITVWTEGSTPPALARLARDLFVAFYFEPATFGARDLRMCEVSDHGERTGAYLALVTSASVANIREAGGLPRLRLSSSSLV